MRLTKGEIRVAVVGSGPHALRRGRQLQQCDHTVITRVASTSDSLPVDEVDREAIRDWRQAVCSEDVDAVVVCTPLRMRPEVAIAAMEAGKHVLCDQPIADNVEAALSLVRVAKRLQVVLGCSYYDRHRSAIRQVKEWIEYGAIGDPMIVTCRVAGTTYPSGVMESVPTDLVELTVRGIDLARWMFGGLEDVADLVGLPAEGAAEALMTGPQGRVARIQASLHEGRDVCSVEVLAKEGYASGGPAAVGSVEERAAFGQRDFLGPFSETTVHFVGPDLEARSRRLDWQTFANAIESGLDLENLLRDGIDALRLVTTIPGLIPVEHAPQVV